MRILVFGDSIAQGFWDPQGGWVERLRSHYWQQFIDGTDSDPPSVFNLAISGNTSDDVLARFYNEAKSRITDDLILVFAVGVNDSRMHGDEPVSSVETYRQNLIAIISQAKQLTDKIIFVGCTNVDETLTTPVSWADTSYFNERIWEFETVLREICAADNLPFVPVWETYQQHTDYFSDGLHPNQKGHQAIYDLVLPEVEKLVN